MKLTNKKAYFEYEVLDTWTAGIVLRGTEIKSIREGSISFADSFAYIKDNALFVRGMTIALYSHGTCNNHDPEREKKLLLKKKEIKKIGDGLDQGITIKLLSIFINKRGFCKVEVGLCKGKKLYDKRETIKARDVERESQREI